MRINALRREAGLLIGRHGTNRPPALRRSGSAEWLYATDVPSLLSSEALEQLLQELEAAGWTTALERGWILLRKKAEEPPEDWHEGRFGPEAGCCLSLLERHADECRDDPGEAQRALIKAGEQGAAAYEEICESLHSDWAERLRQRRPLPAVSRKYFGA